MIERLKNILEFYNLSSSSFAEKIEVPRSSISHLLSGRNKPSLDFIIKVDKAFEEVELDWLLYGKGSFPKNKEKPPSLFNQKIVKTIKEENNFDIKEKNSYLENSKSKLLIKIILLYNDGSFDEFNK